MICRIGSKIRINWLYYTLVFGSLPIVLRFALSTSSADIPPVSVGDAVFFGIMLNGAAVANVAAMKKPVADVLLGIFVLSAMNSIGLAAIYCADLFVGLNVVLATSLCALLFFSLLLSWGTTNSTDLVQLQRAFNTANFIETLPIHERQPWLKLADYVLDMENNETHLNSLTEEERAAVSVLTKKLTIKWDGSNN